MIIKLSATTLKEIIKFGIVGCICTGIDALIFYLSHEYWGYQLAIAIGFILSIGINYLLNIYWSFSSSPSIKNAMGVLGAHTFNIFVVRFGLMWLFVNIFTLTESIAYVPTLLISVLTNFIIIRIIIKNLK